ncbi:hypothetical protein GH714_035560 [Hevea brasiliensis]|uniref:C2H2-type domain-containing protein n=1 Tax=Hevea brasiliensis TaxID=3981 RepID=A0A6A6KT11_HEVBR|nr:hypothetical protein GH714_035560 [Hevea brasiliensis]
MDDHQLQYQPPLEDSAAKTSKLCIKIKIPNNTTYTTRKPGGEGGGVEASAALATFKANLLDIVSTFLSTNSLFGHMRYHPDRDWKGIRPPPPPPLFPKNQIISSALEKVSDSSIDLLDSLSGGWQKKGKRGTCASDLIPEAAYSLLTLSRYFVYPHHQHITCDKSFPTFHALRSHRSSFNCKKRSNELASGSAMVDDDASAAEEIPASEPDDETEETREDDPCPALGGHKRCHRRAPAKPLSNEAVSAEASYVASNTASSGEAEGIQAGHGVIGFDLTSLM